MTIDKIAQKEYENCKNRKDGQNPRKWVVEINQVRETEKRPKTGQKNRRKSRRM